MGVRQNLLGAAVEGLRAGYGTQGEVLELVRCVRDEERPEVYQVLFQLLETLIYRSQQQGERVELAVAEAVWERVDRLVETPALLNPVAGAAFFGSQSFGDAGRLLLGVAVTGADAAFVSGGGY